MIASNFAIDGESYDKKGVTAILNFSCFIIAHVSISWAEIVFAE